MVRVQPFLLVIDRTEHRLCLSGRTWTVHAIKSPASMSVAWLVDESGRKTTMSRWGMAAHLHQMRSRGASLHATQHRQGGSLERPSAHHEGWKPRCGRRS